MKSLWFSKCKTQEDKEELTANLWANGPAIDQLREIIRKKEKPISLSQDYSNPSWAYKQADVNGYNRALKEISDLLNLNNDQ
jgi:hypothetical protein